MQPFVFVHHRAVHDIRSCLAVRLLEVASLLNLQSHRAQISGVAQHHLHVHRLVTVAAKPPHILVAGTYCILCIPHALHEWQLLQFSPYGSFLLTSLCCESGEEHLVLGEAVVAVEDVVRLARHHTNIYRQDESHAELHSHYRHAQFPAAR